MTFDRLRDAIARVVLGVLGVDPDAGHVPRLDRLALYRARVHAASSDGQFLDVTPDDARIPPMSKVPLRVGIPGAVAVVEPIAYVLVGWEAGDPARPYCLPSWEHGASVLRVTLVADQIELNAAGKQPVARKTDPVRVTIPPGTVVIAAPGGTVNPTPIELDGTIQDGSSSVYAGA